MADRSRRKVFLGRVVSNKVEKTITVAVERRFRHPLYGKYVTKTSKFVAHDENNECNVGDIIRIMEVRPLSRRKRWRLIEVVKKAQ
jgi:small subunit ribosomal protein S17